MEDYQIIELYWNRDENAIAETDRKYGKYCRKIAYNILFDREDTEECTNDTYLQTWNTIPPHNPERLSTYVGKICRNLAINLYEKNTAAKRGGAESDACLEELENVLGAPSEAEEQADLHFLTDTINTFLARSDKQSRILFVQRYWYMMSVKDIARENRMSESKVKMSLLRTREKLREYLQKEGYEV